MRIISFILIIILLLLVSCAQKISPQENPPDEYILCGNDNECIPQPGCHPINCINIEFKNLFDSPEACTFEYRCGAAYNKEDCICQNDKCTNKKQIEGDPSCDI